MTTQDKSPPGRDPQGGTRLEWTRKSMEAGVARQVCMKGRVTGNGIRELMWAAIARTLKAIERV